MEEDHFSYEIVPTESEARFRVPELKLDFHRSSEAEVEVELLELNIDKEQSDRDL